MPTEAEQAAALRNVLDAPLGKWSAYDYDDVPTELPNMYALITVSRRFGDDFRLSGDRILIGYRLTTLAVGRSTDEARWVRDLIAAAISDEPFEVDNEVSTRIRFETENPIEPDEGRYSGLTSWTYAI